MNAQTGKIFVTKSFLPPIEEYNAMVAKIWETAWLTNAGPLVHQLETRLAKQLGVKHVLFMSNGTIAIQIALRALGIHGDGEVITTPFSYVATTSSILWEHAKPVFADVDPTTLCLDPKAVEKLITPNTKAIMPVHVYGVPCDVKGFDALSKKYNIPVIYDAAHAFGTLVDGKSVLNYGTLSTLSFHATKLFHTGEGGAIVTNDDEIVKKISLLRSFGHVGDEHFVLGVNGKNSEFHAAMGLVNLEHIDDILASRKSITALYDDALRPLIEAGRLQRPVVADGVDYNSSYYPVVFESEEIMQAVNTYLQENNIIPRRYFFPSLNTLPYVNGESCPISESASARVLCLPIYYQLPPEDVKRIAELVTVKMQECYE